MSSLRRGNLVKYYVMLHALLCDIATQLYYDLHSEGCLHMLGIYFVEPRIFICNNFAEFVYVMEKCYQIN
jgi:hypothetical protein